MANSVISGDRGGGVGSGERGSFEWRNGTNFNKVLFSWKVIFYFVESCVGGG